jgi:hypothetical protein
MVRISNLMFPINLRINENMKATSLWLFLTCIPNAR